MALPAVYRRKVGRDLAGAYGWYEDQRPGLGEEFLGAVDASFDAIQEFPDIFARVHGEVRRAIVFAISVCGVLPRRTEARCGPRRPSHGP